MINRRKFLSSSAVFGAALVTLPRSVAFAADEVVITILHTNDTHSQIDPLPANDKNAGKGGIARRATLVKRIRKENPNTLLIDAGDVLQGTPYFNFYRGEVEYKAMSAIGYDASTLGNHEFDNGIEALAAALQKGGGVSGTADRSNPPVHFLFPGQGAQYVGMGRELYAREPALREAFDACAAVPDHELEPVVQQELRRHIDSEDLWYAHEYVPFDQGENFAFLGGRWKANGGRVIESLVG